ETEWMTRQQIVETAYEAILRLNRLKAKYGIIPQQMAGAGEERIKAAWEMAQRIDDILTRGDYQEELPRLKARIDEINAFPVVERRQLELPVGLVKLKFLRSLWSWATGR
ncbi:unnamed protein product, partial [marine sediment metagenome]